jgi:hypothetical protein
MLTEQLSRIVSASVTPIVVISASALLCLAFYNRLAAIVQRLRLVQRERLDIQDRLDRMSPADCGNGGGLRHTTILESLAEQTFRIHRRARLIRNTLLCLLAAIGSLIISSLLGGITIVFPAALIGGIAFFVCGMLLLFSGVACAAFELLYALSPAELESQVVSALTGFD